MHFVFVACNKNKKRYMEDPSFIYRCENLSAGLKKLGHSTLLTHLSALKIEKKTDVVVFHRPRFSLTLFAFVLYLKQKNILAVYDVDDLIFDPEYAAESPAYINHILSLKKVKKQFQSNLKALHLFEHISVSTETLQSHIKRLLPQAKVALLANAVHHTWKNKQQNRVPAQHKILSYFPGTRSHDRDFESIAKALNRFLTAHPELRLHITGPLHFRLDVPDEQVIHKEKVPFGEHWKNYENIWVNLAPLEQNWFTSCKSALKVIEAGHWGIPTITSYNPDCERFKESAVLCDSEEAWFNTLERLYDNSYYERATKNIENEIESLASVDQTARSFAAYSVSQSKLLKRKNISTSKFPRLQAKKRRKEGKYDCQTLWYFRRAWMERKHPKRLIDYCLFRRDMGFVLTEHRAGRILESFSNVSGKYKEKAVLLLLEAKEKPYTDDKTFQEISAVFEPLDVQQKALWKTFRQYLLEMSSEGICVVGNAATLNASHLGSRIDANGLVIRFNQCWKEGEGDRDTGQKLDIWVSAPDFKGSSQDRAAWHILSGPDILYRKSTWKYLQRPDIKTLTIPLEVWKKLVFELQAPPSAGLLTLYWFHTILGSWDNICAAGFDLEQKNSIYHHSDPRHQPSMRHQWLKEASLLKQWQHEGLSFLF